MKAGLDQRKLFVAAKDWLPKIGYKEVCVHGYKSVALQAKLTITSALISSTPWFQGYTVASMVALVFLPGKSDLWYRMSSSDPDSKIDLLDSPDIVTKKIRKALAVPKVVEENGLLAFVEFVLLPSSGLSGRREFRVDRERDGLEPLVYTSIDKMHEDYKNDVVCLMSFSYSTI